MVNKPNLSGPEEVTQAELSGLVRLLFVWFFFSFIKISCQAKVKDLLFWVQLLRSFSFEGLKDSIKLF